MAFTFRESHAKGKVWIDFIIKQVKQYVNVFSLLVQFA